METEVKRERPRWMDMRFVKRYPHFSMFESQSGYRECYSNQEVDNYMKIKEAQMFGGGSK